MFECKSRLSCFVNISEEPEYTLNTREKEQNSDILSDDSSDKVFEDFGELALKVAKFSKKKSNRAQNRKKLVVQEAPANNFAIDFKKTGNKSIKTFIPSQ